MFLRIRGRSMLQALRPGDWLWASPRTGRLERRDIVAFNSSAGGALLIKRIVGLPHEHISIQGATVRVNGQALPEPYVDPRAALEPVRDAEWRPGGDEYVVLGDARDDSLDSRRLGVLSRSAIVARALWRLWPPGRWGRLVLLFWLGAMPGFSRAASGERILAFAHKRDLLLFVGKYDPARGWVEPNEFYQPPQPADPVTIVGVGGRLGVVRVTSRWRPSPWETPADWTATVSSWTWQGQPEALAVLGDWPQAIAAAASAIALDDPDALSQVGAYLKSKGLHVSRPYLTQAFTVDLDGDGRPERFYCAHSDDAAIRAAYPADVYAVALMVRNGRTTALASQTWHKPAHRTRAEEASAHGTRDFLRFIAFPDLTGNGRKEAVLYRAKTDATQVDVFELHGDDMRDVLTGYRALLF